MPTSQTKCLMQLSGRSRFQRKLVLPQSTGRARLSRFLQARLQRNSGHSGSQVSQAALGQDRPTGPGTQLECQS